HGASSVPTWLAQSAAWPAGTHEPSSLHAVGSPNAVRNRQTTSIAPWQLRASNPSSRDHRQHRDSLPSPLLLPPRASASSTSRGAVGEFIGALGGRITAEKVGVRSPYTPRNTTDAWFETRHPPEEVSC